MTDKILSTRAKKRIGKTKSERSEKMKVVAKSKWEKISKKDRTKHALKMRAGIKPKTVV